MTGTTQSDQPVRPRRRVATSPAGPPATVAEEQTSEKPSKPAKAVRKASPKKSASSAAEPDSQAVPVKTAARAGGRKAAAKVAGGGEVLPAPASMLAPIFQAPVAIPIAEPAAKRAAPRRKAVVQVADAVSSESGESAQLEAEPAAGPESADEESAKRRRRRRRGGRGRKRTDREFAEDGHDDPTDEENDENGDEEVTDAHRRRRRRRSTGDDIEGEIIDADGVKTVIKVREARPATRPRREVGDSSSVVSTRLEAKKQRRRDGRDTVRRRAPIITEAQFLARRESVDRQMLVRQTGDRTQIAVTEDNILVEHYVNRASNTSYVGNVYLGKVQNVLPSMEAAFVDIGKGRNAVLYAGEVNWDAAGLADGTPKRIETALKTGQSVLVQVTKDPIGQKGARLTSQISLPGRHLVYVPGGGMSGISRKLPDTERNRLKQILKQLVPEDAGVIVRTAAEGASEEELTRDVNRLLAQWEDIQQKSTAALTANGNSPVLLYGEPDLTVRVIRDIFNEDVRRLTVQGDDAWDEITAYLGHVAPDLVTKLSRWTSERDLFAEHHIDEQLAKALDRKVWLPSGGSLVIDRTEAMVVIDVNTGKFTGKGGNLEETVTKNNLEAAEEIARQLRLRDLGGIIVIDFIDMVLESNRDQVLRRLTECLGRDRTKHQVAEVTSLGLVQMTRKRIGQGLLEAFSTPCEHCHGRGVIIQFEPVDQGQSQRRHRHFEHKAEELAESEAESLASASVADFREVQADPGKSVAKTRRRSPKKAQKSK